MTVIDVRFWLNGTEWAGRDMHQLPHIGERVVLRTGIYRVTDIEWNLVKEPYLEEPYLVNITLQRAGNARKE